MGITTPRAVAGRPPGVRGTAGGAAWCARAHLVHGRAIGGRRKKKKKEKKM